MIKVRAKFTANVIGSGQVNEVVCFNALFFYLYP